MFRAEAYDSYLVFEKPEVGEWCEVYYYAKGNRIKGEIGFIGKSSDLKKNKVKKAVKNMLGPFKSMIQGIDTSIWIKRTKNGFADLEYWWAIRYPAGVIYFEELQVSGRALIKLDSEEEFRCEIADIISTNQRKEIIDKCRYCNAGFVGPVRFDNCAIPKLIWLRPRKDDE